jgi:hypothetical protein
MPSTLTPPATAIPAFVAAGDGAGFTPRLALARDELEAWDRNGFHIHEPLFSRAEVDAIREACERVSYGATATGAPPDCAMWTPDRPRTDLCKIDNAWKADPLIQAAVTSERLGRVAAQLIGAHGIRLWHDQYLRKPSDGGGIVAWHQDWMYWQAIDRCRTVTAWIALCDVEPDMGPMVFLQGSHRNGLHLSMRPDYHTGTVLPPSPIDGDLPHVPVLVRAGQVTFHHGNTMHASDVNRSGRNRYSIVSHLMADDCCFSEAMGHLCIDKMKQQPDCPKPGERFRGPQFPYAYQAEA